MLNTFTGKIVMQIVDYSTYGFFTSDKTLIEIEFIENVFMDTSTTFEVLLNTTGLTPKHFHYYKIHEKIINTNKSKMKLLADKRYEEYARVREEEKYLYDKLYASEPILKNKHIYAERVFDDRVALLISEVKPKAWI